MTRRKILALAGAGVLAPALHGASEPQNFSIALSKVEGFVTASDLFFVRDHFAEPSVSIEDWELRIDGLVKRPYSLNFSDLLEHPTKKVEALLECSGNAPSGAAVSNGVWEGVPLSFLLTPAQLDSQSAFVLLEGADQGILREGATAAHYSQLVPISKCLDANSLLAFKLNGVFLPMRNGFPARALFPGWYAMNSVKWVRRMTVLPAGDRENGFYRSGMDGLYNRHIETGSTSKVERLTELQVKSVIAWPGGSAKLPAGRHKVWGFAWSGGSTIARVEISFDGGKSWDVARLERSPAALTWVRWSYDWKASPAPYTLLCRATDSKGNRQPARRDETRKDGYELNWCEPTRCTVF